MERAHRLEGELCGCPGCGRQPLLVESLAGGWRCECAPCGVRLWMRATRQEAVGDWEALPRTVPPAIEPQPLAAA